MSKKLTPWFEEHTKPARKGFYETKWLWTGSRRCLRYWNGKHWLRPGEQSASTLQLFFWRGLKEPA
jgi:hypothetical protein